MQNKYNKFVKSCCFFSVLGLICLMMGFSLPVCAAEGGSCGSNLKWKLSGDTLTISGSGDMTDYKNDELAPWYTYAEEIRTVELPAGLTSIGDYSFSGCINLTNINIPDKVVKIGNYSFAGCTGLLRVNYGSGVQSIGKGAFHQCESLTSVTFPSSLTSIGSKAFYRCYGLQTVTIPSNVTYMGSSVFAYCENIVRAVINASIDSVPTWTFYGCSNLSDVSLASEIISVGEHAFYDCENLKGIHTQSGDIYVASGLDESIPEEDDMPKQGYVTTNDMPETSVSVVEKGDITTKTEAIQKGDNVVVVKESTDHSTAVEVPNKVIEAVIEKSEDWTNLAEVVDRELLKGVTGSLTVKVQLLENKVEEASLVSFASKAVVLEITTENGVVWKVDMSKVSEKDIKGNYNFSVEILKPDKQNRKIESDNVYKVKFADRFNFNVTVGFKVGNLREKATFYQKKAMSYKELVTVVVDYDNYAWFSLAGIDKGHDYYIGLDVADVVAEDVVIPKTMYQEYGLNEDGSYLTDEDGMQYRITGRTSRWGITGKQFVMYVGAAIGATVLIVGSVMVTLHIIKKSREKYERMAEEDAIREQEEEDTLRMEIMKELLGESEKKE